MAATRLTAGAGGAREAEILEASYRALPQAARQVALALGVCYPAAATAAAIARAVGACGLQDGPGETVSEGAYRDTADALIAAGIAYRNARQHLTVYGRWAPWLTLQALREGSLSTIESHFVRTLPAEVRPAVEGDAEGMVRRHVVAGRFDDLGHALPAITPCEWRWLAHPGGAGLLATLPGRWIDDAARACLAACVAHAADPVPLLKALAGSSADPGAYGGWVALIRLLQGRADRALDLFAALPDAAAHSRQARVDQASTLAMISTLEGDDVAAARRIREAIAHARAGTRRRNVFPAAPSFALALLSLVRRSNPANAALLEQLLRTGSRLEIDREIPDLVQGATHLSAGEDPTAFSGIVPVSLRGLCLGLLACWGQSLRSFVEGGGPAALSEFGLRAHAHGYLWLATEAAEVIGRVAAASSDNGLECDRAAELAQALAATDDPAEAARVGHQRMGTTTLAALLAPAPEWEAALRGIEQHAHESERTAPAHSQPAPANADRRLAWVVIEADADGFRVVPRAQSRLRRGGWGRGRVVALRRLRARADDPGHLSEQDHRVIDCIAEESVCAGAGVHLPRAGVFALAGHPAVFGAGGQAIEVVRRDPEIAIEDCEGQLRVTLSPHLAETAPARYRTVMTRPTRCEVTRFSDAHRRLCTWIPPEGAFFPATTRDRLIHALAALSDEIRIRGALGGDARAARQIAGDPIPWVRLAPGGAGLNVAIRVEPVPASGIFFRPGDGDLATFAAVGGEGVQAARDPEAEREALQELVQACPTLATIGSDCTLALQDPVECLELIEQLEATGARCQWPQGQPFRIAGRAGASALRLTVKSATDWFTASGSVRVDRGRAVDLRTLFEMLDANPSSRFVSLGDGAFLSLTTSFRRQLEDLRALSTPTGGKALRLNGLAALALDDLLGDAHLRADARWKRLHRKLREAESLDPQIPPGLQTALRPYQEEGFRWLVRLSHWGGGACLADDMGLGKTVQTLALLLARAADGPALVVAPTSVVDNWVEEVRRFAPSLKVRSLTGSATARARLLDNPAPGDLFITTYGLLHNDSDLLAAVHWSSVVLDEAQAIRNPATRRARASRRLRARFRMVTTGTPIQNNLADLHSIFSFLNPGLLGSARSFREQFALPIERARDPVARMRLRRLTRPFVLRRVKADVLDDLPSRTEVTLLVEMSPAEAAFYEGLRLRALDDLEALASGGSDGEAHRMQILTHLTRLRLACCNPELVHAGGPASSKLQVFADTLDELRRGGHRVLVFSQFVRHLRLVQAHVRNAGIPCQHLDGSTPARVRAERIRAFQRGEGDLFLISLKAGGVGLNLTAADYVIHMDPWWNPAAEDQASDRAHRIGQTRPVTIYRLVVRGTIEEQIVELHRHKRELADRLLADADVPVRLTTEETLRLLGGDVRSAAVP